MKSKYKKGDLLRYHFGRGSDGDGYGPELVMVLDVIENWCGPGNRCYRLCCVVDGHTSNTRISVVDNSRHISLVARGQ